MDQDVGNRSEFDRLLNQERVILDATELILELLERNGLNRADLAERLGKSRGFVSQLLNGSRNMTLRTLSDIFGALGHGISLHAQPFETGAKSEIPPVATVHDMITYRRGRQKPKIDPDSFKASKRPSRGVSLGA